jgi:hypothetical protein
MGSRRARILRWASAAAVAGIIPAQAQAQGPIRRMIAQTCDHAHEKFIGYPEYFAVPPLGASLYGTLGLMRARADGHRFALYRSDVAGATASLTPAGAQRLGLLASRLPGWPGPVVIEWTPEAPALAEARRATILAALHGSGIPIGADRVAIGPSPYPGLLGTDAANNYDTMIIRGTEAPRAYSLTPTSTATFGGGAR